MTPSSFVHLGWHFVWRIVARLIRRENGLARFEANYCRQDRLLPLSQQEREAVYRLSRCIACGMCDAHFDAYDRTDPAAFQAPSDLPLSYSRSLPDYDALDAYLRNLNKGDLERLERVCPVDVPFRRLAEFAQQRAARSRSSDGEPPSKEHERKD